MLHLMSIDHQMDTIITLLSQIKYNIMAACIFKIKTQYNQNDDYLIERWGLRHITGKM